MSTQKQKAERFRELHEGPRCFAIPNPWDVASAKLLANLGFEALATTGAGAALSLGRSDNQLGRERMLAHIRDIVEATDLPVSADFENGFAEAPAGVAANLLKAAATGLAGASIEDSTQRPEDPLFPIEFAAERVRAAAEAVHALPQPFLLTARAENYHVGQPDLADAIRRLQAYQEAGADVLFCPGVKTLEEIGEIVRSVDRPVNVLMGFPGVKITMPQLQELGVRRVSLGASLTRAAYGAFLRAARELKEKGTFEYVEEAVPYTDLVKSFESD